MEFPITLPELLVFITSIGGISAWATWVSDFYRNKGAELLAGVGAFWRQVIVYASMASLPVVGYLIVQFVPPSFVEVAAPHFEFAMMVLTALLGARGIYELVKHRPAGNNQALAALLNVATVEERAVVLELMRRAEEGTPAQPGTKPDADALQPAA